jgi:dethiobiotin synthetase
MNDIAIVGIHTGIGKTIASAILAQAIQADYWKPIQAGGLDDSDTIKVKSLVSSSNSFFHPEAFRLKLAMSPHAAAEKEGVKIELSKIILPKSNRSIVVETAGGLLSPINNTKTNLDLLNHLQLPVILVTKNYLGSINHTMLTYSQLIQNNIKVKGIVFNGISNPDTEDFIIRNTGLSVLFSINEEKLIDRSIVMQYAQQVNLKLLYQ